MKHPPRIQRLIESRDMEAIEPDPERVTGLWEKALASNQDSRKGLSPDNAISLAYQAGFQACTALLEAHGYRTKGSNPGHHYRVFYATSGLGYPDPFTAATRRTPLRWTRYTSGSTTSSPLSTAPCRRRCTRRDRSLSFAHATRRKIPLQSGGYSHEQEKEQPHAALLLRSRRSAERATRPRRG
jgi:hypothetical protein